MSKETIEQAITNGDPIKALNWKEPFASLMLPPHNKVETRTWLTHIRGLVLICTSLKAYDTTDMYDLCGGQGQTVEIRRLLKENSPFSFDQRNGGLLGKAIAIGRLVDCRKLRKDDKHFLLWEDGMEERYAHIYEDVHPIEPFAFKGGQKWKIVTDEVRSQIKLL